MHREEEWNVIQTVHLPDADAAQSVLSIGIRKLGHFFPGGIAARGTAVDDTAA